MARSALELSEITDRALVVSDLSSLGRSQRWKDSQIRDKLTIYFQRRKLSRGGDVVEVIYPLTPSKDDAIVIFEESRDRESAINHEQVFYEQPITVSRLPPVFTSIHAEIHPLYFQFMHPRPMADEFPKRLQRSADVVVDAANYSRISCSNPLELLKVQREVIRWVGLSSQDDAFPGNLLAQDGVPEGASSSTFTSEASHQPRKLETFGGRPRGVQHHDQISEERKEGANADLSLRESEEPEQFVYGTQKRPYSSGDGRDQAEISSSAGVQESRTTGKAGYHDVYVSRPSQDTDVILDKYTYEYLQTFEDKDLKAIWRKYDAHLKIYPGKTEGDLEGVISPVSANASTENVTKAREEFITFYQKAHVDILRKTIDGSSVGLPQVEVATRKTEHDFKADTLIKEIGSSPSCARLILRRGDVEEVARVFRSYAGIKSGKTLRAARAGDQDIQTSDQHLKTTTTITQRSSKDTQIAAETLNNSSDSTQLGKGTRVATEIPHQLQKTSLTSSPQPSQFPYEGNFVTNEGMDIVIRQADITKQRADAVVSPSGTYLDNPTGGVGQAIFAAAGPKLRKCCSQIMQNRHSYPLQVGECVITNGFKLIHHKIIHVSDPSPLSRIFDSALYKTFIVCLQKAEELDMESLAIPLLSLQSIGESKQLCAVVLATALLNFSYNSSMYRPKSKRVLTVYLVNADSESTQACSQAIQAALGAQVRDGSAGSRDATSGIAPSESPTATGMPQGQVQHPLSKDVVAGNTNRLQPGDLKLSSPTIGSGISNGNGPSAAADTPPLRATGTQADPLNAKTSATGMPQGQVQHPLSKDVVAGNTNGLQPGDLKLSSPTIGSGISNESYGNSPSAAADTPPLRVTGTQADPLKAKTSAGSTYDKSCLICLADDMVDEVVLQCKHWFCKECIDKALQSSYRCPVCKAVCKQPKGNQPEGTMRTHTDTYFHLPGYRNDGVITIYYNIPGGIQTEDHPKPGKYFAGATLTAYLPDNQEGREVLRLLRKAFDARLMFTVTDEGSVTSGIDDTVTCYDIHHKTSRIGGPSYYGYPDPDYLKRVREDLAAKGIV